MVACRLGPEAESRQVSKKTLDLGRQVWWVRDGKRSASKLAIDRRFSASAITSSHRLLLSASICTVSAGTPAAYHNIF